MIYEALNILYVCFKFTKLVKYKINIKTDISFISMSIFPVMVVIFNLIMDLEINQMLILLSVIFVSIDLIRFTRLNKLFFNKKR